MSLMRRQRTSVTGKWSLGQNPAAVRHSEALPLRSGMIPVLVERAGPPPRPEPRRCVSSRPRSPALSQASRRNVSGNGRVAERSFLQMSRPWVRVSQPDSAGGPSSSCAWRLYYGSTSPWSSNTTVPACPDCANASTPSPSSPFGVDPSPWTRTAPGLSSIRMAGQRGTLCLFDWIHIWRCSGTASPSPEIPPLPSWTSSPFRPFYVKRVRELLFGRRGTRHDPIPAEASVRN